MGTKSKIRQDGTFTIGTLLPFGAMVTGMEFSSDVTISELSELRRLLNEHHVLVFRGHRAPKDSEYVRFLRHFGELSTNEAVDPGYLRPGFPEIIVISNIVENGKKIGAAQDVKGLDWHTDYSWQDRVSVAGALESVETPHSGGETCFVNMYAVYEALEPALRTKVDGLRALHEIKGTELRDASAEHPLVATNPISGRRALYINPHFTTKLIGIDEGEGERLLLRLIDISMSSQFLYKHSWLSDLVLWDQIGLIHARMPYRENERRYMRQITVLAEDASAPWRSH